MATPKAPGTTSDGYLKLLISFLSKSEGKDKLLATIQYAAMLVSAGQPGIAQSIQKSLVAARKPMRVLKVREIESASAAALPGVPPVSLFSGKWGDTRPSSRLDGP